MSKRHDPDVVMDVRLARDWNAYPSMHISELKKAVAEGRGNPKMEQEIADRESGKSQVKVTPQIQGGKAQTRVGRM